MALPNVGSLLATTLNNYRGEFADNMSTGNLLLHKLKHKGCFTELDGGNEIEERLEYGEMQPQYFDGGFEAWDMSPHEFLDVAKWQWKYCVLPVTVKGSDVRKNSGKAQIRNLVTMTVKNAEKSFRNRLAKDLYGDGTSDNGRAIQGLASFLHDDPSLPSLVGGIQQSVNPWWRNQVVDKADLGIATVDKDTILRLMNRLWQKTKLGTETPDLGILADTLYTAYEESLQANMRFSDAKLADAGFSTLKYKSMDVSDDPGMPMASDRGYFLNTAYIKFRAHKDANFEKLDERVPVNQDAWTVPMLLMGNMTVTNRQRQGVLKA